MQPITLADVPQHLIDAVLAIEDRRFYEHDGVDYEGTTRALFQNLDAGEVEQGGSTVTQQLVKNTMGDPEKRDLKTKIREAVLAVRLENEMSKNEILERYLNVIYLGNGAYGIKAASERYFGQAGSETTHDRRIRAPRRPHPVARGAEPRDAPRPCRAPPLDRHRRAARTRRDHRGRGARRARGAVAHHRHGVRTGGATTSRRKS